jgi:hypothetical protein
MKIEVIKYLPKHIMEIMEKHPRSKEIYWSKYKDWGKWLILWEERGPSYTMIIDDAVVMCAGVVIQGGGVGEAWMVLSELFYQYKKECFRVVRDKLDEIILGNELKRVQSLILTDFPEAERWVIHLGFKYDMPTLGPNEENMLLYARVIT